MILCFMDQFILNSNFGARAWKQNQKAQWLWSSLSKWISDNWRGTLPHPWWLECMRVSQLKNGGVQHPHPEVWGQITVGRRGWEGGRNCISPYMLLIAPVGPWTWMFFKGLDISSAKASLPESCWLSSCLSMLSGCTKVTLSRNW